MNSVHEILAKEFGEEWTALDPRAQTDVVEDFRRVIADPKGFDYNPNQSFAELAREYHRNIGQGHLAVYASCLATHVYGRSDTSFDGAARAFLVSLAERRIGRELRVLANELPSSEEMTKRLNATRMNLHYAEMLADGVLPECGHPVTDAVRFDGGHWACSSHEHPYTGEQVLLEATAQLIAA
jgi:hypothetical protein